MICLHNNLNRMFWTSGFVVTIQIQPFWSQICGHNSSQIRGLGRQICVLWTSYTNLATLAFLNTCWFICWPLGVVFLLLFIFLMVSARNVEGSRNLDRKFGTKIMNLHSQQAIFHVKLIDGSLTWTLFGNKNLDKLVKIYHICFIVEISCCKVTKITVCYVVIKQFLS